MRQFMAFITIGFIGIACVYSINYTYEEADLFGTTLYYRRAYEDNPQTLYPGSSLKYYTVESGSSSSSYLPSPESRNYEKKSYHVFYQNNPNETIILMEKEYKDFLKLIDSITVSTSKKQNEDFLFLLYKFNNVTYDNLYKRIRMEKYIPMGPETVDFMASVSKLTGDKVTYEEWVDPIKLIVIYDIKNNSLDSIIEFIYVGGDWLFMKKAVLLINDSVHEILFDDVTRDTLPKGSVMESASVLGTPYESILNSINEIDIENTDNEDKICRFYGDSYYADFYYTETFRESIELFLDIKSMIK